MQKVEIDMKMRGYVISDDIEDVEYVDVSEDSEASANDQKSPSYDKDARSAEIFAYAEKKAGELNKMNDHLLNLFFITTISFGAEWSDANPEYKFKTSTDRSESFCSEVERLRQRMVTEHGKEHPEIHLLIMLAASLGMKWATNNPPKYH